jgi:transposase-like protein
MDTRSPFTRRRWTEEDARLVLAALERSGKSVSAFAKERGLDAQRLYSWRRRFIAVAGGDTTTFRELTVRPSSPATVESQFEISFPSGVHIRVPAGFDAAALARLLDVLTQARVC